MHVDMTVTTLSLYAIAMGSLTDASMSSTFLFEEYWDSRLKGRGDDDPK